MATGTVVYPNPGWCLPPPPPAPGRRQGLLPPLRSGCSRPVDGAAMPGLQNPSPCPILAQHPYPSGSLLSPMRDNGLSARSIGTARFLPVGTRPVDSGNRNGSDERVFATGVGAGLAGISLESRLPHPPAWPADWWPQGSPPLCRCIIPLIKMSYSPFLLPRRSLHCERAFLLDVNFRDPRSHVLLPFPGGLPYDSNTEEETTP